MIDVGIPKTDTLENAVISAVAHEGLTVQLKDGRVGRLAVVDDSGHVIEAGASVAVEAWNVTIAAYKNFRIGMGHMRVYSSPPGMGRLVGKAA